MKKLLAALPLIAALAGQAVAGPVAQAAGTPAVRVVRLGRRGRRLLEQVNARVNDELIPGEPRPDLPDGKVDCEDYAALKRTRLAEAGVPRSAMRTWDVTVPWGERHQVLVVYGEDGPHVLDNLHARPRRVAELGYRDWAPNWPPARAGQAAPADPVADWIARVAN